MKTSCYTIVILALVLGFVLTADAATFTVNSTLDTPDANAGNGMCADSGNLCTLRAAIEEANALAGTDTISFAIAGAGVKTFMPATTMPAIVQPIVIDGYTQSGSSVNTSITTDNAVILIELNGINAGAGANGLSFQTSDSTVRGLTINRFARDGISLNGGSMNTITGNFIGTDTTGLLDFGNGECGVRGEFGSSPNSNLIGGITPASRNIISGNGTYGIVFSIFAFNSVIQGNLIGLGSDGSTSIGNGGIGIDIDSFVSGFVVGGDDLADGSADGVVHARNYISGNGNSGMFLGGAVFGGATVQGNYIGTDTTGTLARPNSSGIITNLAHGLIVGGATAGAGNLISGNSFDGINIGNTGSMVIKGNRIGTQADGVTALGNGTNGIQFNASSSNTQVGGIMAGEANVIAFNGGDGVQMDSGSGNAIRANSIHNNGTMPNQLGIDLGLDDVNLNDFDDVDVGSNNLQNFPVINSAVSSATTVTGTLNSTPNTSFALDFYSTPAADPSTHGEGQTFIGSTNVMTDGAGNTNFSASFPVSTPVGQFVTATATDLVGNTSEFSFARQIIGPSATNATLSGRVLTADGIGIRNARVLLTSADGAVRYAVTGSFGYYSFMDVPVGESYVLSVISKRYHFNSQIISILDELNEMDLIAINSTASGIFVTNKKGDQKDEK